jgi:hypothetical protein
LAIATSTGTRSRPARAAPAKDYLTTEADAV